MNKFELTDQQLNNLFVFLNRASLQGAESPTFMELVQIFQNPIKGEISVNKKDIKLMGEQKNDKSIHSKERTNNEGN